MPDEVNFMSELGEVLEKESKISGGDPKSPLGGNPPAAPPEAGTDAKAAAPAPKRSRRQAVKLDPPKAEEPRAAADPTEEKPAPQEEPPSLDEGVIERAVRAGLPLADAREFRSTPALERVVERLEASSKLKADADLTKEQPADDDDPASKIPDLDPEEYEAKLVDAFKAVKGLVARQHAVLKDLRGQMAKAASEPKRAWLDNEIERLGQKYVDVFGDGDPGALTGSQRGAREKLRRHVEFAESEAKADGRSITKAQAFASALESAFGKKVSEVNGAAAAEAAAQRAKRAVTRPRDTTGRFATDGDRIGPVSERDREADALLAVKAFYEDS